MDVFSCCSYVHLGLYHDFSSPKSFLGARLRCAFSSPSSLRMLVPLLCSGVIGSTVVEGDGGVTGVEVCACK